MEGRWKQMRAGYVERVSLLITLRCNLACPLCSCVNRAGDEYEMTNEEFDETVSALRAYDIRHVSFTGGEPLLHPRVRDMARRVRAELRPQVFMLRTNGVRRPTDLYELFDHVAFSLYVGRTDHLLDALPAGPHRSCEVRDGLWDLRADPRLSQADAEFAAARCGNIAVIASRGRFYRCCLAETVERVHRPADATCSVSARVADWVDALAALEQWRICRHCALAKLIVEHFADASDH
jgi:hypothetical protein